MTVELQKVNDWCWRLPRAGRMHTDGIVFASERQITSLATDRCLDQVRNVACLPGIVGPSIGMPDIHWGYGFPIGGVAGFDLDEGVISPGGVGYDINCGVRLLTTSLRIGDIRERVPALVQGLFRKIPSGVGKSRRDLRLSRADARRMATQGARWAVQQGFGSAEDLGHIEEGGCLEGADFGEISDRAFERGRSQLGTIGSGNHFVEVGYVDEVYDTRLASQIGLAPQIVTVIIHTGSRGFGYQICDDFLRDMVRAAAQHGIDLPDRQLCCAPLKSDAGRRYFAAMKCGANFAFNNRQIVMHWVREAFENDLGLAPKEHGLRIVYDVCHNIAKVEEHRIDGKARRVCVHRKGATRSFPAGHPDVPEVYRSVGQPVLVPGDMGRYSYVLVGHPEAPDFAFASCCHGAGRVLSRRAAKRATRERHIIRELAERGITVAAASRSTVDEEFPDAYKDVSEVVEVVHNARLALKVGRLRPVGVIKG